MAIAAEGYEGEFDTAHMSRGRGRRLAGSSGGQLLEMLVIIGHRVWFGGVASYLIGSVIQSFSS